MTNQFSIDGAPESMRKAYFDWCGISEDWAEYMERDYKQKIMPMVQNLILSFKKEMAESDPEFVKAKEKERLWVKYNELKLRRNLLLSYQPADEMLPKIMESMSWIEKRIKSLENNQPKLSGITPAMIERAKAYPLDQIITTPIRRFITNCISGSHLDNSPSMNIKNNYCYCHSCNYSTDSIGAYMKINSCDFRTAVKALS